MRLPAIFIIIATVCAIAACGGSSGGGSASTDTPTPVDLYQRGLEDGYKGGFSDGIDWGWTNGGLAAAGCYDPSINPGGIDCGMLKCVLPFLWDKPRPLKIGGLPATKCDSTLINFPPKDKCARADWFDYPDCKTPAPTVNR
jgi:hypothetical protein